MTRKLSKLLLLVGLVALVFPTYSSAVENDTSYEDGQIIAVFDYFSDFSHLLPPNFDPDISYEDGQIIFVSQSDSVISSSDSEDGSITPSGFFHYIDKTIAIYYADFDQIPQSYDYTEYNDGYWYSGPLPLQSAVRSGSGWVATFSETIPAWID